MSITLFTINRYSCAYAHFYPRFTPKCPHFYLTFTLPHPMFTRSQNVQYRARGAPASQTKSSIPVEAKYALLRVLTLLDPLLLARKRVAMLSFV